MSLLGALDKDPPPGIVCYPIDDDMTKLESYMKGPPDSPYEKGLFQLEIRIPQQYPFEPPQIRFKTPVYHPNIDDGGRICIDILKGGEKGAWKPSMNIATTLISLNQLLACPNPDDPLDAEIAKEYQLDHERFLRNARALTLKYATGQHHVSYWKRNMYFYADH
ncbi:ubiquitin-conjugating enzyme/RWD-like protein [Radiomyces spectabilis]|uniref:ubiquitin-conjugating enzyme/RWD-like protein n=1 Tax=Radiomyces spectabilis TaxID=64574 RepID=UPI0022204A0D|nr:ubiquitin-conjugating enzyme/RWD-like protein [Radiomyces spectabilis]KAI8388111.1 ubiquitin-conjugating enzyme/RWD-like protein [Radiomyces spectabilis]